MKKIDETDAGYGGEIHLTDALTKLDSLYGVVYDGESHYIENISDGIKTSIRFDLDDKDDLVSI